MKVQGILSPQLDDLLYWMRLRPRINVHLPNSQAIRNTIDPLHEHDVVYTPWLRGIVPLLVEAATLVCCVHHPIGEMLFLHRNCLRINQ